MKINKHYLATEGIPQLMTVSIPVMIAIAFASGWIHGVINTVFSVIFFLLCVWSLAYREYEEVKNKVGKKMFSVFCLSFMLLILGLSESYAIRNEYMTTALCLMAISIVQLLIIGNVYNRKIRISGTKESLSD